MSGMLIKTLTGYEPFDDEAKENWKNTHVGELVKAKTTKPRHPEFHKKYFKLLDITFKNQSEFEIKKWFLEDIKIRLGHCETFITEDGHTLYKTKSISFARMDDIKFRRFYNDTINIILSHYLKGLTAEELDRQVDITLSFA